MTTAIPSFNSGNKTVREYDILSAGDYPARITRFIGLGVQEQPAFKGQAKNPAFKAMFELELIGVDATGTETKDGVTTPLDPAPSCQFHDVFLFPGASRGKVFDLCKVLDTSIEAVPGDLEWFKAKLGEIVNVNVGQYTVKNGPNAGKVRNCVNGVSAIPNMFKAQVGEARRETVYFNPYDDSQEALAAYSELFQYQRKMLEDAIDSENIPYAGKEPSRDGGQSTTQPTTTNSTGSSDVDFDDDIPF